jgi:tripartite-type tricarboxylate transporter receptor subunit TctC
VTKAVNSPRIQALRDRGMRIVGDSPQEFGALIVAERNKWGKIIKSAKIAVE